MLKRTILYSINLAAICLITSVMTTFAQEPVFSIQPLEGNLVTAPYGFVDFHVVVRNLTTSDIQVTMIRSKNQLPNQSWYSAICTGELCYAPEIDTSQAFTVKGGKIIITRLSVQAGTVADESGRVELTYVLGGEKYSHEFAVTVSAPSSVDPMSAISQSALVPNPAVQKVRYHYNLPSAGESTIELFTPAGERVMKLENGYQNAGDQTADLEIGSLAGGLYIVRLTGDGVSDTQTLVVAR